MSIGNWRASFIDYRKPGIFLITMAKNDCIPPFSSILRTGRDDKYKGTNVKYDPIGYVISEKIKNFSELFPKLRILQYIIMPDHIHFILQITEELDKHLDAYMQEFKTKIFETCLQANLVSHSDFIFKYGYNDQFLIHSRKLNDLFVYIWENPYRLWIRKTKPEYFTKANEVSIFEVNCQLYGNLELLKNPFIYPVVVHRRYTEEKKKSLRQQWEYAVNNDGVLVSAFISKEEKPWFELACRKGGKIILFQNYGYSEREKPRKKLFDMCEQGKMLIISPKFPDEIELPIGKNGKPELTKKQSRFMNEIIENF
ncbi:MAG: hypothetical protein J1D77_08280 [Muribaculaceae bacterium]|nr:hypothetical protein [Muribaculaceae bacterium]